MCLPKVKENGGLTTCIIISSQFSNKMRLKKMKNYKHRNKEKRRKDVRTFGKVKMKEMN
jgi:hypothetical protein